MKSALRTAVVAKDANKVQYLLADGAAVDETDDYGWTALMLASKYNQPQIVQLLLEHNATAEMHNTLSKTALDYALENNYAQVLQYLLRSGAVLRPQDIGRIFDIDTATLQELDGHTDLIYQRMKKEEWLSQSDQRASEKGFNTAIQILSEFMASGYYLQETSRSSALLAAAQRGHLQAIHLFLNAGSSINSRGKESLTPLMLAAAAGHIPIVKQLLQYGADLNIRDFFGETALTLALQRNHIDMSLLLIGMGADVNVIVAHDGSTPLTIAKTMKLPPAVRLRLENSGAKA
jgi:ankyrin repeat protein